MIIGQYPKSKDQVFTGPMRVIYNLTQSWEDKGIELSIPARKFKNYNKYLKKILFVFEAFHSDADIFSLHGFSPAILFSSIVGLLRRKKIQVTVHGLIFLERQMGEGHPFWKEIIERFILKTADKIVTISLSMKLSISSHYNISPKKIDIIPHGVGNIFLNDEITKKLFSDKYDCRGVKVISFVGGTKKVKNLLFLLKALKKVKTKNWKLYIIGPPKDQDRKLKSWVSENNFSKKVYFTGPFNQKMLRSAYRRTDVFVLPSRYESFGLVALEAMASETSTIVSDKVGMSFMIKHGQNGYVVEHGNISQLSQLIDKLLGHSEIREEMAKRARMTAKKYSWANIADIYISLFHNLIKN
ncbi:MAG TPA: glycosyltransferase family 4 protein [Patescibacteria group bacterium]|nr:glycosyltransferase family 4 protein [Patescibacteria group bacterium]